MSNKTYTIEEALELLRKGKKVKGRNWKETHFVMRGSSIEDNKGNRQFSSENSFMGIFGQMIFVEHEPVSAPIQSLSIEEAAELLRQGKKIALPNWGKGYYYLDDCYRIRNHKGDVYYYNMTEFICHGHPTNWMEKIIESDTSIQEKIRRMDKSNNTDMLGYPSLIKEAPGRCCKCDSPDEWNSKGKDGKWYCYKHC